MVESPKLDASQCQDRRERIKCMEMSAHHAHLDTLCNAGPSGPVNSKRSHGDRDFFNATRIHIELEIRLPSRSWGTRESQLQDRYWITKIIVPVGHPFRIETDKIRVSSVYRQQGMSPTGSGVDKEDLSRLLNPSPSSWTAATRS